MPNEIVRQALEKAAETDACEIGRGAVDRVAEVFARFFRGPAMVVADEITFGVAGERVTGVLREAGLEDDTIVVFTSDHGDMNAAHQMEHKSFTYEEAARVPFIFQVPGRTRAGHVDDENLTSNGLDLLPTLCDLAGVATPPDLPGSYRLKYPAVFSARLRPCLLWGGPRKLKYPPGTPTVGPHQILPGPYPPAPGCPVFERRAGRRRQLHRGEQR